MKLLQKVRHHVFWNTVYILSDCSNDQIQIIDKTNAIYYRLVTCHQNRVLVDNKEAQHAESDWLAVQTAQKHIYLYNTCINLNEAYLHNNIDCTKVRLFI